MTYSTKILLTYAIWLCFSSCEDNVSRPPVFADGGATINLLKSAYQCESIGFENWEEDDATDSSLTICLINSKSVPSGKADENFELLRNIGRQVQKSLTKPNQYKTYYVIFVKTDRNPLFGSKAHTYGADIRSEDL